MIGKKRRMVRALVFVCWVWVLPAEALASDTLRLGSLTGRRSLFELATVRETRLGVLRAEAHRQPTQALRRGTPTRADRAYWLEVVLHNDADTTRLVFLYTSDNQLVTAYLLRPSSVDSLRSGTMLPTSAWASAETDNVIPLPLKPRETVALLLRVANAPSLLPVWTGLNRPRPSLSLAFQAEAYYRERQLASYLRNLPEFQYRSWVQGAMLFLLLFVGLIYARHRQPVYRHYLGYVLAGCGLALLKTRAYTPLGQGLGHFPLMKAHLPETLMWVALGAYLFFVNELLELPRSHPRASRRLRRAAWGCFGFGAAYLAVMLLTNDGGFQQVTFWGTRLVLVPSYLGLLVWMGRAVPSPLTRYVILGNALMAAVGVLAWLRAGEVILKGVYLPGGVDNLLTLSFALLLEMLVFALALAQRVRLLDRERSASQRAYIAQLEENRQYEKRLAEIEMLALRSQMNPHFLFNSLNTLEYFILSGEEQKASEYLAKFSRLLRMILNHSREEAIPLADELTALRLYLDLEAARFGDEFSYHIEADAAVDQQALLIPPMLLQPFVENAIWHGLRQSDQPAKRLCIRILADGPQTVTFEVEDNGIGRQRAAELQRNSAVRRKSHALEITQQRVDLFNRQNPAHLRVQLLDLQQNGQTGTLVRVTYRVGREAFEVQG